MALTGAISGLAFTGTLPEIGPTPSFQWLAIAGLSFAAMIVNSYYTSAVTARSVFSAFNDEAITIEQVVSRRHKICGMAPVKKAYEDRFPGILHESLWVTVADMAQLLKGMDDGRCRYAVFTEEWWDFATAGYWQPPVYSNTYSSRQSAQADHHCQTKEPIPQPLDQTIGMPVALPVNPDIQMVMSYIFNKAVAEGKWTSTLTEQKKLKLASDHAQDTAGCEAAPRKPLQLDLSTSMAPCLVVVTAGVLAVVGHFFWKLVLARLERHLESAVVHSAKYLADEAIQTQAGERAHKLVHIATRQLHRAAGMAATAIDAALAPQDSGDGSGGEASEQVAEQLRRLNDRLQVIEGRCQNIEYQVIKRRWQQQDSQRAACQADMNVVTVTASLRRKVPA